MRIVEQLATSIVVKSNLPDADYVINPYVGCSFACSYCYASFMGRTVNQPRENWGNYVHVKTNTVELARKELSRRSFREGKPTILISSVTDAWQGLERKYRLARGVLEVLVELRYAGRISILTKSPLLLRDVGLLSSLQDVEVGVTVTTDDDAVGKFYEGRAPRNSARTAVLRRLSAHGIPCYAFVGPLMTHYVDDPDTIDRLLGELRDAGVKFIYAELLNVSAPLLHRLQRSLDGTTEEIEAFVTSQLDQHRRDALARTVLRLVEKHGLSLRLGRVLDHVADRRRGEN